MIPYTIKETDDFYTLAKFFSENGLETSIQKTTPEGIVNMWRLEHRWGIWRGVKCFPEIIRKTL